MSAYLVDKKHVAYLVNCAISFRIADSRGKFNFYHKGKWIEVNYDNKEEIATMLLRENVKSINYRYNERKRTPKVTRKDFNGFLTLPFDALQLIRSCKCYNYQACEHDGYEKSQAKSFIKALIDSAINEIPGYGEKAWGYPGEFKKATV